MWANSVAKKALQEAYCLHNTLTHPSSPLEALEASAGALSIIWGSVIKKGCEPVGQTPEKNTEDDQISEKKKGFRKVVEQGWLSLESKKTKGNMITVFNVSTEYARG